MINAHGNLRLAEREEKKNHNFFNSLMKVCLAFSPLTVEKKKKRGTADLSLNDNIFFLSPSYLVSSVCEHTIQLNSNSFGISGQCTNWI